jgi:serine phosphatase RsbU (regulator of sigma subunit)
MTLLLFTDGITESVNEADKEFGIERLVEVFNHTCTEELPSHEIIERILRSVDDFTESRQQGDDQTLLVIKRS